MRPAASIGVVVPTYNRADVLVRCLTHLEAQTCKDFEVVVVDDGSTDDTAAVLAEYASRSPLRLRWVSQKNTGPAGARNHAISLLHAPVCLMIGDDILAAPIFVQKHLDLHRREAGSEIAGLGLTRWSEQGQRVTPFMRWLDQEGMQFAYKELLAGQSPSWRHFYTSNLSVKTEQVQSHSFLETFTRYGMEDIELGYRLASKGMLRMFFLPEALAEHVHPTGVAQACRRMIAAGYSEYEFCRLWPEQTPPHFSGKRKNALRGLLSKPAVLPYLQKAASVLTGVWCPNPLLKKVLLLHHWIGYREAEKKMQPTK